MRINNAELRGQMEAFPDDAIVELDLRPGINQDLSAIELRLVQNPDTLPVLVIQCK